jgi:hypothetical protein
LDIFLLTDSFEAGGGEAAQDIVSASDVTA